MALTSRLVLASGLDDATRRSIGGFPEEVTMVMLVMGDLIVRVHSDHWAISCLSASHNMYTY
jgi:hypothetical protein